MIRLDEIQDYVQNTAEIISSVLEMEVIIVDSRRDILGDSDPFPEKTDGVETKSVLNVVMERKNAIVLDSRDDNPGCLICKNRQLCKVESMKMNKGCNACLVEIKIEHMTGKAAIELIKDNIKKEMEDTYDL